MTTALTLPASVRDRPCFTQYMGALAIDEQFFEQAVKTIEAMGMPAIWAANEKVPPSVFNTSIWSLAVSLRTAGIDVELPDASAYKPPAASEGAQQTDEYGTPPYVIVKGTAIIPVNGPLSKQASSLQGIFGGSSTVGMRKALALAMADSKVQRVMFHVDSPGGTVAGTGDLGDDIYLASAKKPIAAFVEDMGTSAAYWISSQAGAIYASQYANVGSIGVIWTVYDTSEAYQKEGIKVHAITSSPGKAFMVDGMPITKQQFAKMQAYVSSVYNSFVAVVARGRGVGLEEANTMAGNADIYPASAALDLGLIDAISTFHDALIDFAANGKPRAVVASADARMKKRATPAATDGAAAETFLIAPPDGAERASPDADEGDSNTAQNLHDSEEPHMDPPANPAAKPASAPVTMSADEHAKLTANAAAGAEALALVKQMQTQQANAAASALVSERERIVAENPIITKAAAEACKDLDSLRALESTARAAKVQRTGADPGTRSAAEKTADEEAAAEIKAWQADLGARGKAMREAGNLAEVA